MCFGAAIFSVNINPGFYFINNDWHCNLVFLIKLLLLSSRRWNSQRHPAV
jgi:hypothetical protein